MAGLRQLGVPAVQAVGVRGSSEGQTAVCFETPADYEITVAGRKLVGSAQWRARGGVLQHGTLPLCGDLGRVVSFLAFSDAEREIQRDRILLQATTLEEAAGRALAFDTVAEALAAGFARALNLTLVRGEVTAGERSLASDLRDQVYSAPDWTARV